MKNNSVVFKNICVVTPDDGEVKTYKNANVAVEGKKIKYLGKSFDKAMESISNKESDVEVYEGKNRIILPCFVNSHTHLAMTLLRNRNDDTTLHNWLFNKIFPVEEKMRSQELNSGTMLGIAEMIKSGTGACSNMYMAFEDAVDADIATETGIKLNTVFNGGEKKIKSGKLEADFDLFDEYFYKYDSSANGNIRCGVLVHSIYLYEENYYYKMAQLAKERDTFIHIHLSETEKEVSDCMEKYKMRPPAILNKMGIFDVPCIAAHCVYLDDDDRDILKRKGVTIVHNPASNLKLGSGMADLKKMVDAGINVAIGTDGPASNNNLDIYREMRFASYLAKGINKDACVLSANEILKSATVNGMVGLGFLDSGEIKAGKDADLQVINTDMPSMTPLGDPVSGIVYSAGSECVESVMVSGKMLMRNRELLTIDEEKAIFEANKSVEYLYGKK